MNNPNQSLEPKLPGYQTGPFKASSDLQAPLVQRIWVSEVTFALSRIQMEFLHFSTWFVLPCETSLDPCAKLRWKWNLDV